MRKNKTWISFNPGESEQCWKYNRQIETYSAIHPANTNMLANHPDQTERFVLMMSEAWHRSQPHLLPMRKRVREGEIGIKPIRVKLVKINR